MYGHIACGLEEGNALTIIPKKNLIRNIGFDI